MASFDGFKEVVSRIIDTRKNIGKPLRIGTPLDDDLVEVVLGFEFTVKFSKHCSMELCRQSYRMSLRILST